MNSFKSKSAIANFFYNLLKTKPPNLAKFYFGLSFFRLGNSYRSFISLLTKHYPFSLLYQDRLFHHNNLRVNTLMIRMEKLAKKAGVNMSILSGYKEDAITELIGYLDRKTKNRSGTLKTLETALQKKYETIYVREEGKKVRILIPTSMFEGTINPG